MAGWVWWNTCSCCLAVLDVWGLVSVRLTASTLGKGSLCFSLIPSPPFSPSHPLTSGNTSQLKDRSIRIKHSAHAFKENKLPNFWPPRRLQLLLPFYFVRFFLLSELEAGRLICPYCFCAYLFFCPTFPQ